MGIEGEERRGGERGGRIRGEGGRRGDIRGEEGVRQEEREVRLLPLHRDERALDLLVRGKLDLDIIVKRHNLLLRCQRGGRGGERNCAGTVPVGDCPSATRSTGRCGT